MLHLYKGERLDLFIVNECLGYTRPEYKMRGIRLICVSLKKEEAEASTHLRLENKDLAVRAMPAGFAYFKQIEDGGLRFSGQLCLWAFHPYLLLQCN